MDALPRPRADYGWSVEFADTAPAIAAYERREIHSAPGTRTSILAGPRAPDDIYFVRFGDMAEAVVDTGSLAVVTYPLEAGASAESLEHVWLDLLLPTLVAHQGSLVLHAGGVALEDRAAILFMGRSGLGKSTLTASFSSAGATVLNDDAIIVAHRDGSFEGRGLYRGLRLQPDSLEAMFAGRFASKPMAHYSAKRRLDLDGRGDFPAGRLAAMFFLTEPSGHPEIELAPIADAQLCIALLANSFSLDPADTERARERLRQASALANAVPAFELSYPRDYARLPEVREAIVRQVSSRRDNASNATATNHA